MPNRPEPVYSDMDDASDDRWRFPSTRFQQQFLETCMRKRYQTQAERERVCRIEKKVKPYEPGSEVLSKDRIIYIPAEYLKELQIWTAEQNRKAGFAKIQLTVLIGMTLATDRIAKWLNRNAVEAENRDGYTSDDD